MDVLKPNNTPQSMTNKGYRGFVRMAKDNSKKNRVSKVRTIYPTGGSAKEFAEWALTIYEGCNFGCFYCYARKMAKRFKMYDPLVPQPRPRLIEALKIEALRHKGKQIFLSFMSDPYPEVESDLEITRQVIKILLAAGCSVKVLSKSGYGRRDFDLLSGDPGSMYGVSLTGAAPSQEPYAHLIQYRIYSLAEAFHMGVRTFVSLEPVINPDEIFRYIKIIKGFTNEIYVGKLTRDSAAASIDWQDFTVDVVQALEAAGYVDKRVAPHLDRVYYIKDSLQEYLPE